MRQLNPYNKGNKWGFRTLSGQVIIPCLYESVGAFSGGLVKVCANGKFGFYNNVGRQIIPCIIDEFTYGWGEDFEIIENFTDAGKYIIVLIQDGKYLLDKKGNLYDYDWLGYERDNNHFTLGTKPAEYIEKLGHWSELIDISTK